MKHQEQFEFSPRIIRLLGEELIHDHKIAISELVKNSYDADANNVKIHINQENIIIEDDGMGMDINIIKKVWLKPGISNKTDNKDRTPKYKRLPLGEKGIGRLGAHRLGNKITIWSRLANKPEVKFSIDWQSFEECTNMKDLQPINIEENSKCSKIKHTGTIIKIENLKKQFDKIDIKNISNDLQKLQSPFESIDNFKIELYSEEGLFKNQEIIDIDYIKEKALFYFYIVFRKDEITNFTYKFLIEPYHKVEPREVGLSGLSKMISMFNEMENVQDIGEVSFEGFIYEFGLNKEVGLGMNKAIKDYLKSNGGIRVYRDGMRVYNYGEEGKDNDILDLDKNRAKKLGDYIGYNQILAIVNIKRENSKALKEKTNREGFIHNEIFFYLRNALDIALGFVVKLRLDDREKLKTAYIGKEYDRGDITERINKIIKNIDTLDICNHKKHVITKELKEFDKEFKNIKNIFLTASNTGLNLTFIIHEVSKIMDVLEGHLKSKNYDKINVVFEHLKKTIEAYKKTIKLDKKLDKHSINDIVAQAIFNFEFRFKNHKIEVIKELQDNIHISIKRNLIIGAVNNIFDNSIYWLTHYKIENKKIYIKSYEDSKYIYLIIADNGKGFTMSFDSAIKPFVTGRFDDSSMGIGLHLVDQIMNAHRGSLILSNYKDEKLTEDFRYGAVLKLIFYRLG